MKSFLQKIRVVAKDEPVIAPVAAQPVPFEKVLSPAFGVFPDAITPYLVHQGEPLEEEFNQHVVDVVMALPEVLPLKAYIEAFNKLSMIGDEPTRHLAAIGTCGHTEEEVQAGRNAAFKFLPIHGEVYRNQAMITVLQRKSKVEEDTQNATEEIERLKTALKNEEAWLGELKQVASDVRDDEEEIVKKYDDLIFSINGTIESLPIPGIYSVAAPILKTP